MSHPFILILALFTAFHGGNLQNKTIRDKTSFSVKIKNEQSNYRVLGIYTMPDETFEIEKAENSPVLEIRATEGNITQSSPKKWQYTAPGQKGLYHIYISDKTSGDEMQLNVFVKVPYAAMKDKKINGYKIGTYPAIPFKGNPRYKQPAGFIEVTEKNLNTLVSPHFTLKQFLCKQASGYPKYLILNERLILKLEYILEAVNKRGYKCNTFFIMSGYRTPFYNEAIGNVKYSRHVYGDAADIFIDEDGDGNMDDLNKDGQITEKDVMILHNIIDELYHNEAYKPFIGGLAKYKKTNAHAGFVHIDTRGKKARW